MLYFLRIMEALLDSIVKHRLFASSMGRGSVVVREPVRGTVLLQSFRNFITLVHPSMLRFFHVYE